MNHTNDDICKKITVNGKHTVTLEEAFNITVGFLKDSQQEVAELKEELKLKTLNEVNASVNADCLDGCRIQREKLKAILKEACGNINAMECSNDIWMPAVASVESDDDLEHMITVRRNYLRFLDQPKVQEIIRDN